MKLLHISDLHLGKRLKGYSLLDDQKDILRQIITTAKEQKVNGVIIAGDIYDVSIPPTEAINLFDKFITDLSYNNIACYAVSGNHDNIYRVTFGSEIMAKGNIYFAKKYSGNITPIKAEKDVFIWLLPFIRPMDVREFYPDFANSSYEEMMQKVIENLDIDETKTNILVAHQFITNNGKPPERSESETISLGTLDNISATNFNKFDYVALGHIHKPQAMGRETLRYCGSPLKYSFSEEKDTKSMVILEVKNKKISIEFHPFTPQRDLREIRGKFEDLKKLTPSEDYIKIVLTDENYITDAKGQLETIFPNIMEISYNNISTSQNQEIIFSDNKEYSPIELFKNFYKQQHNQDLTENQEKIITDIFLEINTEDK